MSYEELMAQTPWDTLSTLWPLGLVVVGLVIGAVFRRM